MQLEWIPVDQVGRQQQQAHLAGSSSWLDRARYADERMASKARKMANQNEPTR